ncbi:hypothetical protein [Catenovulum agarivorans]|uniref:hypothetical protein n=1 Tax=Catenovulum agarivorans TaxID=1172192 RepID=UPI0002E6271E|nr:hypothetical protein [Catenovulum agarivorans]
MSEDIQKIENDVLRKLNDLDVETLNLLEKYAEEHAKALRAQTLVSTVIASIAGAAATSAFVFPEIDKLLLGISSTIFGVLLGFLALRERRKEHSELIRKILDTELGIDSLGELELKKRKIEKIVKGV